MHGHEAGDHGGCGGSAPADFARREALYIFEIDVLGAGGRVGERAGVARLAGLARRHRVVGAQPDPDAHNTVTAGKAGEPRYAGQQAATSTAFPFGQPLYWTMPGRSVFLNLSASF